MLPRLTPKQRQKTNALIKRICANYDNGNCLALDDGEPCVCVQSISYSLLCKYFRNAVLPAEPLLEADILGTRFEKCVSCGAPIIKNAVKINTDPDNPQEVASMDDTKKQLLSDIFWEMNEVSSRTESKTETVIEESDDGNGNIVETETTETKTILYITVSHKTVDEMADQYGFSQEQRDYLAELLKDENNSLWAAALYGIRTGDGEIVTVALSQIGNAGGEPYWSWYGFSSRVEWCACFVSWCANECGYIDAGVIPKFAGCVNGVNWFKERGQWLDGSEEPVPGMIIFFDWDNKGSSGPQDGESDHVGIVERVEDGRVYTVEGNSGDSCRENSYVIGHYEIYGYGVPAY